MLQPKKFVPLQLLLGSYVILSPAFAWGQSSISTQQKKSTNTNTSSAPAPAPARSTSLPERTAPVSSSNGGGNSGYAPRPAANTAGGSSSPSSSSSGSYAPRSYAPGNSGSGSSASRPSSGASSGTTYTPRTYTPGSTAGSSASDPRPATSPNGSTTYTPHTYTPGASGSNSAGRSYAPSAVATPAVRTENGVTTYTPRAPSAIPATPAPNARMKYTPASSSPAPNPSPSATSGSVRSTPEAPRPVYRVSATSIVAKSANGGSTLTATGSHEVVGQLNADRVKLTGINKRPIPSGAVTVESNGSVVVSATGGRDFHLRPNGTIAAFTSHGTAATFRANGSFATLHTPSINIAHGAGGQKTIIATRPDRTVVVSTGPQSGYIQRTVLANGVLYTQRTYGGNALYPNATFTTYTYRSLPLTHFVPAYNYSPAFYGWTYYGWDRPAPYAWGWQNEPWFGVYRGYYSPAAAYVSAAAWLTDFYLGGTLRQAYEQVNGVSSAPDGQGDDPYAQSDTPIATDTRDALTAEIQQQLAYENAAASLGPDQAAALTDLPQVMQPGHLFLVDQPLNVATADDQSCGLSAGDVIRLDAAGTDTSSSLTVTSSRVADCPAGIQVMVGIEDLQEMHNAMRASINAGLRTLHDRQGTGGLPSAPGSAMAASTMDGPNLPADPTDIAGALAALNQQARQAELSASQFGIQSETNRQMSRIQAAQAAAEEAQQGSGPGSSSQSTTGAEPAHKKCPYADLKKCTVRAQ